MRTPVVAVGARNSIASHGPNGRDIHGQEKQNRIAGTKRARRSPHLDVRIVMS